MKFLTSALLLAASTVTGVLSSSLQEREPCSDHEKDAHKPYPPGGHPHYKTPVTIRPSRNSTDDISSELYAAIKKANNGGEVWLKPNETYVIGKKLDLTFLKDFSLKLDGEILVCRLQSISGAWLIETVH